MEAHPSDDNNKKTKQTPEWIKHKMALPEEVAQEPLAQQPAVIDLAQYRVLLRPPRQEPLAPAIGGIHRGICRLSKLQLFIRCTPVAISAMVVIQLAVMLMAEDNPPENIFIRTTAPASITPASVLKGGMSPPRSRSQPSATLYDSDYFTSNLQREPMPQQKMGFAADVYLRDMTVVVQPRQQTRFDNQDNLPLQGVELVGTYPNLTLSCNVCGLHRHTFSCPSCRPNAAVLVGLEKIVSVHLTLVFTL